MVTLDDVAARAGVSRMTASNTLRGKMVGGRPIVKPETAERVRKAAAELGYRPNLAARQLSSGRTGIIGLSVADLDMIFPAALAATLSDEAYRRGYQLITQQTRMSADYEREMLGSASAQICDGTIVCWPSRDTVSALASAHGHPLVVLDGFGLEGSVDCVFTPCVDGAKAAVRHMVASGARRMLVLGTSYCSGNELTKAANSAGLRLRGACEALTEAGLPYGPDDVVPCGWTRQSGYDAMSRILADRGMTAGDGRASHDSLGFDAVFCMTDTVAIGALRALADAGVRVPDDVMVMGFDGVEDGRYTNPGLSSVMIDTAEVSSVCLDMLADRIGKSSARSGVGGAAAGASDAPRTHMLAYRIVSRGSAER
ncbi:LacI family DNA-binding transcriptional regulator [Bifidobacterium aerophilum]|uniref:LacI family DNA-binding transcriptional regulator n=1 Tax=Bifidobacterium aerophilum TaxID=1798155 RepID=A0A6N9Z2Z1_9BIFI|nr:LacI family DNA-binding transcriptional regulator [Bifidobacterium aerophilum]NEG88800.1 LacI family DNA-binding transcriptional regulator [Bifidobacterium aerophilum]